jgi:peroxiredoxin family protein
MSGPVVLFVSSGGHEAAWQAASVGVTAAALGDEVTFVFAFDALRALAAGTFGLPMTPDEDVTAARGRALGAAEPARMLREARALGARLVACDTTARLCGLVPEALEADGALDEVLGLPQIWQRTAGARILSF